MTKHPDNVEIPLIYIILACAAAAGFLAFHSG